MSTRVLLCSDLDRTLIPNGDQPESPEARERLAALARRNEIVLAYVTGRHRALIVEAIELYELPAPQFAVGDVGTTIYRVQEDGWRAWQAWGAEIASDWGGKEARRAVDEQGMSDRLYVARGGYLGMNGNYAAGVLEGLAHFLPETEDWMR